jgi:hypothetical protein
MKKFKNHQRPRRKYRFYIVGHKKALKIWWDSPFKILNFVRLRISRKGEKWLIYIVMMLHGNILLVYIYFLTEVGVPLMSSANR